MVKTRAVADALTTPLFWYSPTRFSKKLVFPRSEMSSIQSKGFFVLYTFSQPSEICRANQPGAHQGQSSPSEACFEIPCEQCLALASAYAVRDTQVREALALNAPAGGQRRSQCSPS
jgi:hypothetical protein